MWPTYEALGCGRKTVAKKCDFTLTAPTAQRVWQTLSPDLATILIKALMMAFK